MPPAADFSDVVRSRPPSPIHPMTALRLMDACPKCVVCGLETPFVCSECDGRVAYCGPLHRKEVGVSTRRLLRNCTERYTGRNSPLPRMLPQQADHPGRGAAHGA